MTLINRVLVMVALSGAAPVASLRAQAPPLPPEVQVSVPIDSGIVWNTTRERAVAWTSVARVDGARSLRLHFDLVQFGDTPAGGTPTVLRLTGLADGAVQHHTVTTLSQWQDASAWFNGDAVRLEVLIDPGAGPSRVRLGHCSMPGPGDGDLRSICGPTDDRQLSYEDRSGRTWVGCTAWIIDDPNHTFLTAGHCANTSGGVEFNVPLSDGDGNYQHPGPEDQYAVDPVSMQWYYGGVGNDWCYFGCFPNTETGLTPYQAQGDFFELADVAPPATGQTIRITGYGSVSPPVSATWNGVQKTHAGPYYSHSGTTIRYTVDTSGGNSGSAVLDESTGFAIGIHTHAGCDPANHGTAIQNAGLQNALANPQGVCIPIGACCVVDQCTLETEDGCAGLGGDYHGVGATCDGNPCDVGECLADVTGDGTVDVSDILAVIAAWGPCKGCPEDIDDSGAVDVGDVLAVIAAWGLCEG